MALTDSIGDFLTRVRNAQLAMHRRTKVFFSKMNLSILEILKREGYILDYHKEVMDNKDFFVVQLKYYNRSPVISEIVRISKPGCRCYFGYKNIPRSYNGLGIFIISTSKGLVTDYDAHNLKIGGEVLCRVF